MNKRVVYANKVIVQTIDPDIAIQFATLYADILEDAQEVRGGFFGTDENNLSIIDEAIVYMSKSKANELLIALQNAKAAGFLE